jgi:hypothetical protein
MKFARAEKQDTYGRGISCGEWVSPVFPYAICGYTAGNYLPSLPLLFEFFLST